MDRIVFIGHIKNDICNIKTLVVAETGLEALEKVIDKFSEGLDVTYQRSDVCVYPFASGYHTPV